MFAVLPILLVACSKKSRTLTVPGTNPLSIEAAKSYLRDSVPKDQFDSLEFDRSLTNKADSTSEYFLRVPFRGFSPGRRFMLVRMDSTFKPVKAFGFDIQRDSTGQDSSVPAAFGFNGRIQKRFLNGILQYSSSIVGGYITAVHAQKPVQVDMMEADDPYIELPEIVIYAPNEDYYVSYDLIIDDGGGGYGGGGFTGYTSSGAGGGGSAGGAGSSSSYSLSEVNELQASKAAVDLTKDFDCFDNVPTARGTEYSASLMVRVPNPGDPDVMWDPTQTSGVGHVFIQLTKSFGSESVTQILGFYGQGGVLYSSETALGFSVPSKIVDNSGHPYNATLTLNLTSDQFEEILSNMQNYSMAKYNISSYNCATYALSVFNGILPTPLEPPSMSIPGQVPGDTPNGLFKLLQTMPADGPDGQVAISKSTLVAGQGNGPCN